MPSAEDDAVLHGEKRLLEQKKKKKKKHKKLKNREKLAKEEKHSAVSQPPIQHVDPVVLEGPATKKHKKQKKLKKHKKQKKQRQTERVITTTVSPFSLESMLLAQQQPHFSGLETDLSAFLKDYERFGNRLSWSEAEYVDRLKQYVALQLQSAVSQFCWSSYGESPPSWEQTKSWLWTQFGGGTVDARLDKASHDLEARSSYQKPNESVDVYRRRFDALVGRINHLRAEWNAASSKAGFRGERPLITSVQKCDYFMRRLKESIFKDVHARCSSRSTIDDIVEFVKRIELTEERFAGSFGGNTPRVQFAAPN